jgi:hypothetical protein
MTGPTVSIPTLHMPSWPLLRELHCETWRKWTQISITEVVNTNSPWNLVDYLKLIRFSLSLQL